MEQPIQLWEILVPCNRLHRAFPHHIPYHISYHKEWDKLVRAISGGLSILKPVKGQWVDDGNEFAEEMIPVRIACTELQIATIIDITLKHYEQEAVFCYRISDKVIIKRKEP